MQSPNEAKYQHAVEISTGHLFRLFVTMGQFLCLFDRDGWLDCNWINSRFYFQCGGNVADSFNLQLTTFQVSFSPFSLFENELIRRIKTRAMFHAALFIEWRDAFTVDSRKIFKNTEKKEHKDNNNNNNFLFKFQMCWKFINRCFFVSIKNLIKVSKFPKKIQKNKLIHFLKINRCFYFLIKNLIKILITEDRYRFT